jgi:hypothetical protein
MAFRLEQKDMILRFLDVDSSTIGILAEKTIIDKRNVVPLMVSFKQENTTAAAKNVTADITIGGKTYSNSNMCDSGQWYCLKMELVDLEVQFEASTGVPFQIGEGSAGQIEYFALAFSDLKIKLTVTLPNVADELAVKASLWSV